MASASLWAQLEQDTFETGFSSFMNGLPDFAGSFTAESSSSPRASPPPPSVPETALTSTRDTPQGADPLPTLTMAWPMATIADDIPRASVVVATGIMQPRPPLPGFMRLQAAVPSSANSDGQTQGAEEPWLRYRCRFPGCNHHYASTDGVRKHCRKKVRMHSETTPPACMAALLTPVLRACAALGMVERPWARRRALLAGHAPIQPSAHALCAEEA